MCCSSNQHPEVTAGHPRLILAHLPNGINIEAQRWSIHVDGMGLISRGNVCNHRKQLLYQRSRESTRRQRERPAEERRLTLRTHGGGVFWPSETGRPLGLSAKVR